MNSVIRSFVVTFHLHNNFDIYDIIIFDIFVLRICFVKSIAQSQRLRKYLSKIMPII